MAESTGTSMQLGAVQPSGSKQETARQPKEKIRGGVDWLTTALKIANTVTHVLLVALTWVAIHYSMGASSTMLYHVIFCTVGSVLLMSEAILVLADTNVWSSFLTRRNRAHVHWVLQVLGAGFTIAGLAIMYEVKKSHFRSVHAITGLSSVVIACVLIAFGYPVLMAVRLRKIVRPVIVKFAHNALGTISFALGITAMCFSYPKKWIPRGGAWISFNDITEWIMVITIVAALLTLVNSIRSLFGLAKSVFR